MRSYALRTPGGSFVQFSSLVRVLPPSETRHSQCCLRGREGKKDVESSSALSVCKKERPCPLCLSFSRLPGDALLLLLQQLCLCRSVRAVWSLMPSPRSPPFSLPRPPFFSLTFKSSFFLLVEPFLRASLLPFSGSAHGGGGNSERIDAYLFGQSRRVHALLAATSPLPRGQRLEKRRDARNFFHPLRHLSNHSKPLGFSSLLSSLLLFALLSRSSSVRRMLLFLQGGNLHLPLSAPGCLPLSPLSTSACLGLSSEKRTCLCVRLALAPAVVTWGLVEVLFLSG